MFSAEWKCWSINWLNLAITHRCVLKFKFHVNVVSAIEVVKRTGYEQIDLFAALLIANSNRRSRFAINIPLTTFTIIPIIVKAFDRPLKYCRKPKENWRTSRRAVDWFANKLKIRFRFHAGLVCLVYIFPLHFPFAHQNARSRWCLQYFRNRY